MELNNILQEWLFQHRTNAANRLVVPSESMTKKISDSIESMPDRSILQLRKYITVLTLSTLVSKTDIKGARERESAQTSEVI